MAGAFSLGRAVDSADAVRQCVAISAARDGADDQRGGFKELGQRFHGSNHIGNLGELMGPSVDDWMAIDVVDAGHDALLEFVL